MRAPPYSPHSDADSNPLTYKWWRYAAADSAVATVTGATAGLLNESMKRIHIVLEVTDNGTPPRTGHPRIVYTIKSF